MAHSDPVRLLSVREVMARTGLARDALAEAIREHDFPAGLPLGPWHTGWREGEIGAWLAARGARAVGNP